MHPVAADVIIRVKELHDRVWCNEYRRRRLHASYMAASLSSGVAQRSGLKASPLNLFWLTPCGF